MPINIVNRIVFENFQAIIQFCLAFMLVDLCCLFFRLHKKFIFTKFYFQDFFLRTFLPIYHHYPSTHIAGHKAIHAARTLKLNFSQQFFYEC